MAERRMFSKTVIDSDHFLEMPASSQLLYFYLALHADDDGLINNAKSLTRMIGCDKEDLQQLIEQKFLISFDSGIVAVRHWKMHNVIRKDTYTPSRFAEERSRLEADGNGIYRYACTEGSENVPQPCTEGSENVPQPCTESSENVPQVCTDSLRDTRTLSETCVHQNRLGKDRSGKDREEGFSPPALAEIRDYCQSRASPVDAQSFFDYYTANGWMAGKETVKDWKAMIRVWERREPKKKGSNPFLEMAVSGHE